MAKDKKPAKTNAMRILDSKKIPYKHYEYEVVEGQLDGMSVAEVLGQDPNRVFKTLVTQGSGREYFVFVIPVNQVLDMKKAARAVGEKNVEMIPLKELLPTTGYIHGGCSPVGMKKEFATVFHSSLLDGPTIICSGGRRGLQVEVDVKDMLAATSGKTCDIILDSVI